MLAKLHLSYFLSPFTILLRMQCTTYVPMHIFVCTMNDHTLIKLCIFQMFISSWIKIMPVTKAMELGFSFCFWKFHFFRFLLFLLLNLCIQQPKLCFHLNKRNNENAKNKKRISSVSAASWKNIIYWIIYIKQIAFKS